MVYCWAYNSHFFGAKGLQRDNKRILELAAKIRDSVSKAGPHLTEVEGEAANKELCRLQEGLLLLRVVS